MRSSSLALNSVKSILCSLIFFAWPAFGQNADHPTQVILPNPTPRQPELDKVFNDHSNEQKRNEALSLEGQLRAREIWLESNQILFLAQQLQQDLVAGKNSSSMAANAAKVGQIEKLARSVQDKMKTH